MMEKRRAPRLDVIWRVRAAGLSGTGAGMTVNVSLCGMLLVPDMQLSHGDLVVLEVNLNGSTTVECVAEVVREFIMDRGEAYGMDFRYISAEDHEKLSRALNILGQSAQAEAA